MLTREFLFSGFDFKELMVRVCCSFGFPRIGCGGLVWGGVGSVG